MSALKIALLLLGLLDGLMRFLRDRDLMERGRASAISQALQSQMKEIAHAHRARLAARARAASEPDSVQDNQWRRD